MAATPEESDHTGAKDRIDDLRISMGTTGLTAKSLLQQLWDFGAPHSGEGSVADDGTGTKVARDSATGDQQLKSKVR